VPEAPPAGPAGRRSPGDDLASARRLRRSAASIHKSRHGVRAHLGCGRACPAGCAPRPSIGGCGAAAFSSFLRIGASPRTFGRVPTIRGRPQLLHDFSVRLYLLMQRDRGQTMAEYALVLAVIALGIFVALGTLRGAIGGALGKVTSDI
jgi:Flp pilus assembly pilin Flp